MFFQTKMKDVAVFFFILAMLVSSSEGKLHDTAAYVDEILSTVYPISIKQANLEVFDMPNFSKEMLHEFQDGAIAKGRIYYHSGNVTGFDTVHLRYCDEPSFANDNLILQCIIVFPRVTVKYAINTQLTVPGTDSETILRERDFGLKCDTINMEAVLNVLISPRFGVPLLKSLPIFNDGTPMYHIVDTEVPEVPISLHILHKFSDILREIFYDVYKKHFAIALGSVPYSLERLKTEL